MNYKKPLNELTGYPKYFVGLDPDDFEDLMDLKFFKINSKEELEKIKQFGNGLFSIADEEVTDKNKFAIFVGAYDDIVIVPIDNNAYLNEYEFKGGIYQMDIFDSAWVRDHSITWDDVQDAYGDFFGDED